MNVFDQQINPLRLRHAIKTGIACLLGLFLLSFYKNDNNQWIIVTIIVVMSAQLNVGSTIQKAIMRFFGTLCGALVALPTLYFFGQDHTLTLIIIIAAITGFSYIATNASDTSYIGTLGAVTVVIILLGKEPSFFVGMTRVAEISVGILISLCVSLLILPLHAHQLLQQSLADLYKKLDIFYILARKTPITPETLVLFHDTEEDIRHGLTDCRKLMKETKREPGKKRFTKQSLHTIEQATREIIRGILHIQHSLMGLPEEMRCILENNIMHSLDENIQTMLQAIAKQFIQPKNTFLLPEVNSTASPEYAIQILKEQIQPIIQNHSPDTQQAIYVFLSAMQQTLEGIRGLAVVLNEKKKTNTH